MKSCFTSLALRFTNFIKPEPPAPGLLFKQWLLAQDEHISFVGLEPELSTFQTHLRAIQQAGADFATAAAREINGTIILSAESRRALSDQSAKLMCGLEHVERHNFDQSVIIADLTEYARESACAHAIQSASKIHRPWWEWTRFLIAGAFGVAAVYFMFFSRTKKKIYLAADFMDRTQHANNTAIAHNDERANKTLHLALNTIVKDEKDTFTRMALREFVSTLTKQANSRSNEFGVRVDVEWHVRGETDLPTWQKVWRNQFGWCLMYFFNHHWDQFYPPDEPWGRNSHIPDDYHQSHPWLSYLITLGTGYPPPSPPPVDMEVQADLPQDEETQVNDHNFMIFRQPEPRTADGLPAIPEGTPVTQALSQNDPPARTDRQGRPVRDAGTGQGRSANRRRNRARENAAARGEPIPDLLPAQARNRRQAGLTVNPPARPPIPAMQAFSVGDLFLPMRADMILEAETDRAIETLRGILAQQEAVERPPGIPVPFIGRPQRLSDIETWAAEPLRAPDAVEAAFAEYSSED
jgi:hypothetical protein